MATGFATYNLTFSYDRYGNMSCFTNGQTNGPCPNFTFNTSNQITTSGYTYDAAGNLTADGSHSYQWDAENHLKSIDNGTNGTFTYNAYGWRVYNTSGPVNHLYDPSGQPIGGNWANGAGWNAGIRFGSRLLAMYGGDGGHTAYFTHANALGSESQTTDYAGNGGQAIISRRPAIGVPAAGQMIERQLGERGPEFTNPRHGGDAAATG